MTVSATLVIKKAIKTVRGVNFETILRGRIKKIPKSGILGNERGIFALNLLGTLDSGVSVFFSEKENLSDSEIELSWEFIENCNWKCRHVN